MYPDEIRGRQEKLKNFLYEISETIPLGENQEIIRQKLNQLKGIYANGFKHSYSDFFPIIVTVFEEDNSYSVDFLLENLERLREYLEAKSQEGCDEYEGIYIQFTKLSDHLNLQISQWNYLINAKKELDSAKEGLKEANEIINKSNEKLEESNRKSASIQTDLVTMLSIFAAVVIAFSGSISALGNAIASAANTETPKLILVLIVCGMILFNAIFLLIYLVAKIINKEIYSECTYTKEKCENCKDVKCKGMKRIKRRLPYLYYFNLLMIVAVVLDIGIWVYWK